MTPAEEHNLLTLSHIKTLCGIVTNLQKRVYAVERELERMQRVKDKRK